MSFVSDAATWFDQGKLLKERVSGMITRAERIILFTDLIRLQ